MFGFTNVIYESYISLVLGVPSWLLCNWFLTSVPKQLHTTLSKEIISEIKPTHRKFFIIWVLMSLSTL